MLLQWITWYHQDAQICTLPVLLPSLGHREKALKLTYTMLLLKIILATLTKKSPAFYISGY